MPIPTKPISIRVEFYDEKHRELLLKYPSAGAIQTIVDGNTIQIPPEEFLTYYLFKRKRPGKPGYRNIDELRTKIQQAYDDLKDWVALDNGTLVSTESRSDQDRGIVERIGESVGLSVVNRIHNLSLADWDRIPEMRGPTATKVFDYKYASDGENILQVETKGSTVSSLQRTPLSNHKHDIELKKQSAIDLAGTYRYGTITALGTSSSLGTTCYLLDPPSFEEMPAPQKTRIIHRMNFLRDLIYFISPQSHLATALTNRVTELALIRDPKELDGRPLLRPNGYPVTQLSIDARGFSRPFPSKSVVLDGPISGDVSRWDRHHLFFFGFRDALVDLAITQDFANLNEMDFPTATIFKRVRCRMSKQRFQKMGLELADIESREKGGAYEFELSGSLSFTREGYVFGLLPFLERKRP